MLDKIDWEDYLDELLEENVGMNVKEAEFIELLDGRRNHEPTKAQLSELRKIWNKVFE